MTAIYCRQSVDKKDSISIEQQAQSCKRLIFDDDYRIYSDKGYTGANTKRPEFEKLMNDIKNKKIKKVICYKVDRISRSLKDFVGIYNEFEKYGVQFVSCSEQFDTSAAMGKATLQIIMVFAELERNMIQKRVKDNFYERARKGLFLAGYAPYGFKKKEIVIDGIHTNMLEPDSQNPEKIKNVVFMFDEYLRNKSLGMTAKKINEKGFKSNRGNNFTSVSVSRILRNPVYVRADADVYMYLKNKGAFINEPIENYKGIYGLTVYGTRKNKTTKKFTDLSGEYVQMNKHEGIIDSKKWLLVQYELDKNKPISNGGKGKNTWLTGLTKCGFCGMGISAVKNKSSKNKRYINCGGRKADFCFGRNSVLTFDEIEEAVRKSLLEYIEKFDFFEPENKNQNETKIKLIQTEEEIKSLISKLPNANQTLFGYINSRIEQLDSIKKQLKNKLISEKSRNFDEYKKALLNQWDDFEFEEKKITANLFIERVIIYNDRIDIIYK